MQKLFDDATEIFNGATELFDEATDFIVALATDLWDGYEIEEEPVGKGGYQ